MNLLPAILAGASLLALSGCATTTPRAARPAATGDAVVDGMALANHAPPKDRALWQCRTAAVALRQARFTEAKQLLDEVIQTIEGRLGPDASARRARGYFNAEAEKTFIGEPYERVMACYYRGILYWMDGEPDNARACFRSAQLHDGDAENKQYAADYVLLDYLDGLATTRLRGDGSPAFARAKSHTAQGPLPAYDQIGNVLVFLEFGDGPRKTSGGEHGELLRFRTPPSTIQAASVKIGIQSLAAKPLDDLHYQATTRGGRVVDHILAGKAQFKSGADSVGDAALISGAVLATQRKQRSNADEIGAGLLLFGLASKIIAGATTPAADTRAWDNLPQYLGFTATSLPPGKHELTVDFQNGAGNVQRSKKVAFTVTDAARDTVLFVSDK